MRTPARGRGSRGGRDARLQLHQEARARGFGIVRGSCNVSRGTAPPAQQSLTRTPPTVPAPPPRQRQRQGSVAERRRDADADRPVRATDATDPRAMPASSTNSAAGTPSSPWIDHALSVAARRAAPCSGSGTKCSHVMAEHGESARHIERDIARLDHRGNLATGNSHRRLGAPRLGRGRRPEGEPATRERWQERQLEPIGAVRRVCILCV
jgi:hypothetical protein